MPRQKAMEKRHAMMSAAKALFLNNSYTDVSMTKISEKAGISKNTLYCHFPNKEALYMAVLSEHWNQDSIPQIEANDARNMSVVLKDFATDVMRFLYHKDTMAFYRTLVAEVVRFPTLTEAIVTESTGPAMSNLKSYFAAQTDKSPAEVDRAARYFFGMLYVDTFWHVLVGFRKPYTEDQLESHINNVVRFFAESFDNI